MSLPAPDRVFIGGSGGNVRGIVEAVQARMERGIVVVNAATLETLHDACNGLEKAGYALRISEVSVARAKPIGSEKAYGRPEPDICDNGREK